MLEGDREPTRIRSGGTRVTNVNDFPDPGLARIEALRDIVSRRQYAKIDGTGVDLMTASAIVKVYDALNPENQAKYRNLPIGRMAAIAWKFIK